MTTKAQRRQRMLGKMYGEQHALERAVLKAARMLRGALQKHVYPESISDTTWLQFNKATDALHKYHADRQRKQRKS